MSKIGKLIIEIPENVSLETRDQKVRVTGPKGVLEKQLPKEISIEKTNTGVKVVKRSKAFRAKSLHGTARAIVANMVKGVLEGWSKSLELVGAGYRAELVGNTLTLYVGYSHPVELVAPEGISFKVEKTDITVEGVDKELVGQIAAKVRAVRPPEPYKGKGIKYKDEEIRRKPGKAAKAVGAPA